MKRFFLLAFSVLLIAILLSMEQREGFLVDPCASNSNCRTCADASGCSWCPAVKRCIQSTTLKSSDPDCNQEVAISSSDRCDLRGKITPPGTSPDNNPLYKDQIADRPRPPNAYQTDSLGYSSDTIMANVNDVRSQLNSLRSLL